MIYNNVRHECNLYNFFFAPRGNRRVMELGMKITQMYLNPFDRIIGIIGAKDSGKSMLIKGMFPGIQTVESDDEYDILDMPLLNSEDVGFYTPRISCTFLQYPYMMAVSFRCHRRISSRILFS